MQETQVRSLVREDPLDRGAWWAAVHGAAGGGDAVEQLSTCMCTQDQVLHALCMLPESSQAPQELGGSLLVLVDETTEARDDCDVPRGTARSQGKICLPPNLVFITRCGNNFCPCKYLQ